MTQPSLQERYAPNSRCFGCGPANAQGLRIGSRRGPAGELVAEWRPERYHEAFEGVLNGGIIGALLDCHANWAAAMHLMERSGATTPPACVTAEYSVRLLKPTPTHGPLHVTARVIDASEDRATVESEISAEGRVTATGRGTFVAVGPGHPAFGRW